MAFAVSSSKAITNSVLKRVADQTQCMKNKVLQGWTICCLYPTEGLTIKNGVSETRLVKNTSVG